MRYFFKYAIWIPIIGLIACGGNTRDAFGPGSSGDETIATGSSTSNDPPSTDPLNRTSQAGGNFLRDFPLNQIFSGGVPPDGIPALTDPQFVDLSSSEAEYLRDDDLVLGVIVNGEAKAYPHNMGWWHEIINDVVGGQPIVVSFCPLTGTGLVFNGLGGDESRIHCGVSGLLFNNNLIMYDRRDRATLYPQMIHVPVDGPGVDALTLMPVIETTWRYWKRLYPDSKVISVDTGIYSSGRYRDYPYGGYRNLSAGPNFPSFPNLSENATAQLFPPKTITLGMRFGETAKAYPFPTMSSESVINDIVAGNELVVVYYGAEKYAIPFSRIVDGQSLTFEKVASSNPLYPFMLRDLETGTTWNLKGEAIGASTKKLKQLPSHNAFWFAWATFWQNTGIN